jgi:hypothetical protein
LKRRLLQNADLIGGTTGRRCGEKCQNALGDFTPARSSPLGATREDAFKLVFVSRLTEVPPRLILLLSDEAAAAPFRGKNWAAAALREFGVEIVVVELPSDTKRAVRAAQDRQYR